jgi:hypothetical protein
MVHGPSIYRIYWRNWLDKVKVAVFGVAGMTALQARFRSAETLVPGLAFVAAHR